MIPEIAHLVATVMIATSPIADDYASFTPPVPLGWQGEIRNADGSSIGDYKTGSVPVDMSLIPESFIQALIATEDHRFYTHPGIDFRALSAAAVDTLSGSFRGGSGLAQQMVKNTITGSDQTLGRKITEAILAVRITNTMGRDLVLQTYLENTWFGRGQNGVSGAPEAWFGKTWRDLSISEIAFLAGLPQGASRLDPLRHPERALARRNHVLSRLQAVGVIGQLERMQLSASPLEVINPGAAAHVPSWISSMVAGQNIDAMIGAQGRTGLVVTTTIDPLWQEISSLALSDILEQHGPRTSFGQADATEMALARNFDPVTISELRARASSAPYPLLMTGPADTGWNAVDLVTGEMISVSIAPGTTPGAGHILTLEPGNRARHNVPLQGAVVAINPTTGELIAGIGGYSAGLSRFDRTRALRQPGSAVKPFLWAAALELGVFPDAYVSNERTTFMVGGQPWTPENYDRSQSAPVMLYQGLERSLNIVAANLIDHIGPENMAEVARLTGAYRQPPMRPVPAAALGSSETSLLNLTSGYATLVNDARPSDPLLISDISRDDRTIHQNSPRISDPVLSRQAIAGILPMLRGVVLRGTAARAMGSVPVAIAGKTGTTQDHRDAWFVGVTPHLALGVWIGRDNNTGMGREATGGTIAARVAAELLTNAHTLGLISSDGLRPGMPAPLVEWPPVMFRDASVAPLNAPAQSAAPQVPQQPEEIVQDYFEIFDGGAHLRPWN